MYLQGAFYAPSSEGGRPRDAVSRSAVHRFTMHLGIRLRRILRCAAGRIVDASLWNPIILKGGKRVGSSLYRLLAFCHAGSLIHAVRFFRKEKSSTLLAGYALRRTEVSAQTELDLPIGLCG